MRILDLFSGIGGFSLGLERAGMTTVAFCEIDPFCQAVLRKHWPRTPIYADIRELDGASVGCDVVTGGFPCQPFSSASRGRRKGTEDNRYLWPEMLRVIREAQPAWVIGENVTHIDRVALEQVVSDLEASDYQVITLEIPACAVGQDHWRARYWILGYSYSYGKPSGTVNEKTSRMQGDRHEAGNSRAPHGIPRGMDANRRKAIGNAVHPEIPEIIGKAIMSLEI